MFLKKGGKGRYKKLKDVYDLKKIKGNYVNTLCHTISKRVIDFVIKANAGTIHLEFLKGMDKNNFLSKYFPYYKLQTCIKYKAENEGIEVKYVDPSYTSQICSVCGNKDKEQRKNMSKFFICKNEKCKNYGKEVDADYNASVNISNSKKYVSKITECEYCNNR
jgi:IS605 OrfB family transposase